MIGFLRGILLEKTPDSLIIDAGGVGYELTVPASSICALPPEGAQASLYIHTHVREDAIRLFGFATLFDRKVFEALLSVSSVGPKLAVTLLGPVDGLELCHALVNSQIALLVSIPGVGAKTAERLILELKTKAQKLIAVQNLYGAEKRATLFPVPEDSIPAGTTSTLRKADFAKLDKKLAQRRILEDLRSALGNLGYKDKQIAEVVSPYEARVQNGEDLTLEMALREALKKLSGHVLLNG